MDGTEESRHIVETLRRKDRHPIAGRGDLLQAGADRADPRPQLIPSKLEYPPILVLRVVDEAVRQIVTELISVALEIRRQRHALGNQDRSAAERASVQVARGRRVNIVQQLIPTHDRTD